MRERTKEYDPYTSATKPDRRDVRTCQTKVVDERGRGKFYRLALIRTFSRGSALNGVQLPLNRCS